MTNARAHARAEERVLVLSRALTIAAAPIAALAVLFLAAGGGLVWILGLAPALLLFGLAYGAGRWSGEPARRPVAIAVTLAAWLWMAMYAAAAILVALVLLVCILPRRPWRLHVLGPLGLGALAVSVFHPQDRWHVAGVQLGELAYWLGAAHVAAVAVLLVMFAGLAAPESRSGNRRQ
jgi:hypothetical protein